ncbi:ribosome hibernation factor-recruiting GTPase MRF [Mycolicibacterium palauense]|uniref:ribosome hibernation factor-recruiting GTPase MRF n=1 Tax=Mycolicibacterium palauense TaxID=2034511 RepID=UPI000BFEE7EB|nr:GTP-binding protein [Mycolicibacterium palauense]
MRTPVIVVTGQEHTAAVTAELLGQPGTVAIEHRFDGHVVCRRMMMGKDGIVRTAQTALELAHGCVSCTIRNDLLVLLRKAARRPEVERIVVHLPPWLEPEPICWAIRHVRVEPGPGFEPGPAARDVVVAAVIAGVDSTVWLAQALGDEELPDGRTVAQAVVAQVEFADVLVCSQPSEDLLAVLSRLNPSARVIANADVVGNVLQRLPAGDGRGRGKDPHGPLLAGQPPLHAAGAVRLLEFQSRRPFHPDRLHEALDVLLEGVVRARGRLWLASNDQQVMWLESAGGGLHVSSAGPWLAAMSASRLAYTAAERRALAAALWDERHGDRHSALVVLVCGADPDTIRSALRGALLTDDEMRNPATWPALHDPFGDWHEDPCDEPAPLPSVAADETTDSEGRQR